MDAAGEWEMDEFVRLIQDPVAGNMVSTLFLNRQRADRIAPAVLDPRTTKVALFGADVPGLRPLLEKGRANVVVGSELGERDIAIAMPGAAADRGIRVAWMASVDELPAKSAQATVWMSEPTALGRTVEVNVPGGDATARDAGLVIARWLRAMALETRGQKPLLPSLQAVKATAAKAGLDEDQELLALALAAADAWGLGAIIDVDLADVGIVVAGLYPPYAGGPFNYIRQCGLANLQLRAAQAAHADSTLFCVPACLASLVEKLTSRHQ
jgi:3-hydroxyacyl-CoA dehydrogenase/enoyl-CoA hydratase/3-hydroxybutyryl-CoA epimerase